MIRQRILTKHKGAVVVRGKADIGFQRLQELLPIAGLEFVRPTLRMPTFSVGLAI